MELVTMNAVLALLVLIALLISLLVRLMITKPSLRAESYALASIAKPADGLS